jgi:subtilisin-like proprotein convertase family protein
MNHHLSTHPCNRSLQLLSLALLGASLWLANSLQAATLTWTGAVNSDWQTAGNWSPAQVPTASDTVNINSGTVTVTTTALFATNNFSGGTLSGTLTVANGKTMNWTSGTVASDGAVTVASGATLNLSGPVTKVLQGGLTNAGTVRWSDGTVFFYGNPYSGRLVNLAGATFEAQGDLQLAAQYGTPPFDNSGTFRKTAGSGNTSFTGVNFNNLATGTVDVQTGTLYLPSGGTLDGTWTLASGTLLHLAGGTFGANGLVQITGQGLGRITSATVLLNLAPAKLPKWDIVSGDVTLNGTVTNLDFASGTLHGTNTVRGVMNWTSGTVASDGAVTVASGATLNLSGPVTKVLQGGLTNAGTVRWSDGTVFFYGNPYSGRLVNLAGATFEAQGDLQLAAQYGTPPFDNSGTFRKTAGSGNTSFTGVNFNNLATGTVDVQTGTLFLPSGGTLDGTWTLASGTLLHLAGGTFGANGPVQITGQGLGRITSATVLLNLAPAKLPKWDIVSGDVTLNGTVTNLDFASGTLHGTNTVRGVMNWTSGTVASDGAVTVASGATLNLSGPVTKVLQGGLTNAGTVRWSDGTVFFYGNPYSGRLVNLAGATFEAQGDLQLAAQYGTPPFDNSGTFRKTAGSGNTSFTGVNFNNLATGTVGVQTGTLFLPSGGTLDGTWTLASGTLLHLAGGTFGANGPVQITGQGLGRITSATVLLNLAPAKLPKWDIVSGDVTLNGTVTNLDFASGTLHGTNTVRGVMNWTSGTVASDGAVTVASGATLNLSGPVTKVLQGGLTNAGTVRWSDGTVFFYGNPYSGRLVNLAGATFEAQGDLQLAAQYGTPPFDNSGTFRKTAGSGSTAFNGVPFANTGTIEALSGTLAFNGGYSMTGGGVTFGFSSATDFGKVTASGTAPLTGALGARLLGSYVPAVGAAFPVMTFGSRSGTFTDTNGLNVGSQRYFEPAYTATTLTLTARFTNDVPPMPVPLPAGSVAWWKGEGNANDSVSTNHGTIIGGVSFEPGLQGQGIRFSGAGSGLAIGAQANAAIDSGSGLTFEAWIKPDSIGTWPVFEWGGSVRPWLWSYGSPAGALRLGIGSGDWLDTGFAVLQAGTFQHLAFTFDRVSGAMKVFSNGVAVVNRATTTWQPLETYELLLGLRPGNAFPGVLDEITLYSRALSTNEIAAIYAAGSAGKTNVANAPQITAQPQSVTNVVGGTANFTVTATGTAPLSYQWRKEGVAIANATNSAFSVQPLALSHAGNYTVVVSNSVNSITSAVAVLTVTNPVAVPLPAGCVAWWRAENNFLDSVGTNHGTGLNGVTFASGEVGQGFNFDGNDGYVSVPSAPELNFDANQDFTVAAWIHPNQFFNGYENALIGKVDIQHIRNGQSPRGWYMWLAQNTRTLQMLINTNGNGSGYYVSGRQVIAAGGWTHVAITHSGTNLLFLVNGALDLATNMPTVSLANNDSLAIGTIYDSFRSPPCDPGTGAKGWVDDVVIFNRALSSNEIAAIYAAGTAGMTLPAIAPAITAQPQSVTNVVGGTANFTVTATGTAPLSYQWRKEGVAIANATNSAFSLQPLALSHAGSYTVVVSNSVNSITSAPPAVLTVWEKPSITAQPPSRTNLAGETVTFTVAAVGTPPPTFQWCRNGTNLPNAGNISGATTPTLTLTSVTGVDDATYAVVVANVAGAITSTPPARLTVVFKPSITTPPQSLSVGVTSNATFSVVAGGTAPLSYQWRRGTTPISGATGTSYTLSNAQLADSGSQFTVVVTNAYDSITSAVAVLTVTSEAGVALPAGCVAWWRGENNFLDSVGTNHGAGLNGATFASGEAGQGFVVDGVNDVVSVPHAPSLSFATNAPMSVEFWAYRTSTAATLHFLAKRDGCGNLNYQLAYTAGTIGFTGVNGPWASLFMPLNTWMHLAGTFDGNTLCTYTNGKLAIAAPGSLGPPNSAPLTIGQAGTCGGLFGGGIDEMAIYSRALSSNEVAAIYAAGSAGKVLPPTAPAIVTQPQGVTNVVGDAATFSVTATGSEPLSYQWRKGSVPLANGGNVSGATSNVFTLANVQLTDAGSYTVVVTNAYGSRTSAAAVLQPRVLVVLFTENFDAGTAGQSLGAAPFNWTLPLGDVRVGTTSHPGWTGNAVVGASTPGQWGEARYPVPNIPTNGIVKLSFDAWAYNLQYGAFIGLTGVQNGQAEAYNLGAWYNNNTGPVWFLESESGLDWLWRSPNPFMRGVTVHGALFVDFDRRRLWAQLNDGAISVITPESVIPDDLQLTGIKIYEDHRAAQVGADFDNLKLEVSGTIPALTAPAITTQPQSQTVLEGASVSFAVSATGTAPLRYQWLFNDAAMASQTNASLTLTGVQTNQAGAYRVQVSNPAGSTNSTSATLAVQYYRDYVFANTNLIRIRDFTTATPYPSTIAVSGVAGALAKVTVAVSRLSHTWPGDIDALVVAPSGQKTLLMSDAGGAAVSEATLIFDDDAPGWLPEWDALVSGTFKPTDYSGYDPANDVFAAPAPAGPYLATLTNFIASLPNGTWSLFVRDDDGKDLGQIANGWSLSLRILATAGSAPAIAPRLLAGSLLQLPDGRHQFNLTGETGRAVEIWGSSDLRAWSLLGTVTPNATGTALFTDPATSVPRRFYRAKVP